MPRQGTRLRFDDIEGYRPLALATNTRVGQLTDLETRRRLRERCQNRIRCAKAPPRLHSGGSPVELDRFALQGCAVSRVGAFSRPRPAGLPAFYQMLTLAGTPPGAGNPRRYACH